MKDYDPRNDSGVRSLDEANRLHNTPALIFRKYSGAEILNSV